MQSFVSNLKMPRIVGETKMKLLITGAFGNVGQEVIKEAFSRGHEITVFEVGVTDSLGFLLHKKYTYLKLDTYKKRKRDFLGFFILLFFAVFRHFGCSCYYSGSDFYCSCSDEQV